MGRQRSRQSPAADHTQFFGSQVGGKSVINYSYTDMPLRLLLWDVTYFFTFAWALPWVVWPVRPCDGGHFDELSFTPENLWCVLIHLVLAVFQLAFIVLLPVAFILPVWLFIAGLIVFFSVNSLLCRCLNGSTITYTSDPKYAPALDEHQHEQWIFLNGVAVGEAWLKNNINRLALTFKRPVIGVHNRTTGIIFDVVECLIQRNFGYATSDIRQAYKIIKGKLYNPQYSKVVFILHSQGGIEGGMVLDWLLQELPQDLLAKLEVYTFGSAANHFNNPHRHAGSQEAEEQHPDTRIKIPATITSVPITDSPVEMKTPMLKRQPSNGNSSSFKTNGEPQTLTSMSSGQVTSPETAFTVPASDRAIGHVEHYAHTTDFVALWGVLHFVSNERASPEMPRFIGRVFSRTSPRGGHQLCQHYLDGMFPLARDADGEFVGCVDSNDFMESVVEVAGKGTEKDVIREGFENSWSMIERGGRQGSGVKTEVAVHGSFHGNKEDIDDGKVRVKDLSRLWLYRNGQSPPEVPRGLTRDEDGIVRGATM
ncbi:Uu.00g135630.m01.CDS01 [Anthostomella pinea]|uniref:Uu.00g135630.m01.CDS01 n=1 Tax=Anthostomella pinea TaxID=933095 RepID=A0AAI8YKT6_9PEZI|nr:Uu.00g135630.m01.CDS01 [Anthostomella pinea]